ncbi:MAG: TSUP family transporter [Rubricoccaceae bacterium]
MTTWEDAALLFGAAFGAALVSGAAGFGGALLLLPLLVRTVGPATAVPLLTVAQLIGNAARVAFGFREIRWRPVLAFLAGALPASVLGALAFVALPRPTVVRLIGAAILAFTLLRLSGWLALRSGAATLVGGGIVTGLASGLVGSAGPLGAAVFLSLGLPPVAYVASEAATALAMHGVKMAVYGATIPLPRAAWGLALLMGGAMIGGTWVAKRWIAQMAPERFRLFVAVLLVALALQMLIAG